MLKKREVPHRLYGHVDAAVEFFGRRLGRGCGDVLAEVRAQNRVADLCRRLRSLFQGVDARAFGGAADPSPRCARPCARRLERDGVEALHAELSRRDAISAERLKPRDRARIARALEVIEATGRSLI